MSLGCLNHDGDLCLRDLGPKAVQKKHVTQGGSKNPLGHTSESLFPGQHSKVVQRRRTHALSESNANKWN